MFAKVFPENPKFSYYLKQKPFIFVLPPVLGTHIVLYCTAEWKMGGMNNVID
jgi:hypothetical protein